ncbi:MAG: aldehyde dehydrogenase family protein [Planctomycetes bacterium]|nr:aldehyde dehydrogenase family protein [Planctomycetota bacterium]
MERGRGRGANCIDGAWRPALRGATFHDAAEGEDWPQSSAEDVALAWQVARAATRGWERTDPAEREELLLELAQALTDDDDVRAALAARCALTECELEPHFAGLVAELDEALQRPLVARAGVSWCAPDWRELVRAPLLDLARELAAGRTVVLVSDARAPELASALARAALRAELPAGTIGLLHGATRELVALGLAGAERGDAQLVASGPVERMSELRRACAARALSDARLRALRCRAYEVDATRELDACAAEVVELAFGRARTFSGQLAGALGRVFCPARRFSAFSAALLAKLEASAAMRAPLAQIDDAAAARVRAAWELGLDEGATCIAGGDGEGRERVLPPTVFTNVEAHMQSAKRQEPLPVLCLLRSS